MLLAPAICVALVVMAFTFLGDGLRDALRSADGGDEVGRVDLEGNGETSRQVDKETGT